METFIGANRATETHIVDSWFRLSGCILEVCRRLGYDIGVPIDRLLNGAAKYLGFRSFEGLQTSMVTAARIATLSEWLIHERLLDEGELEKEELERVSKVWSTLGVAALETPLEPARFSRRSEEESSERSDARINAAFKMADELGRLRESILYRFSITESVISPDALDHAIEFGRYLLKEADLGLRNYSHLLLVDDLMRARFFWARENGLPEGVAKDASCVSRQELFSRSPSLHEVLDKMYQDHEGFVQVARMRRLLQNQPSAWLDAKAGYAPPSYLLLGNAPEHAWVKLEKEGDSYSLLGYVCVPNWSDIPAVMGCSGYMPSLIDSVSLAECQVKQMPPIVGWLRVCWQR